MTDRRTRMKPIYPQTSFARGIKIEPEYVNLHSLSSITTKTFLSDFKGSKGRNFLKKVNQNVKDEHPYKIYLITTNFHEIL